MKERDIRGPELLFAAMISPITIFPMFYKEAGNLWIKLSLWNNRVIRGLKHTGDNEPDIKIDNDTIPCHLLNRLEGLISKLLEDEKSFVARFCTDDDEKEPFTIKWTIERFLSQNPYINLFKL